MLKNKNYFETVHSFFSLLGREICRPPSYVRDYLRKEFRNCRRKQIELPKRVGSVQNIRNYGRQKYKKYSVLCCCSWGRSDDRKILACQDSKLQVSINPLKICQKSKMFFTHTDTIHTSNSNIPAH